MKRFLIVVMLCFIVGFVCPVHSKESPDCSNAKQKLVNARNKYFAFLDNEATNNTKEKKLKSRLDTCQDEVYRKCSGEPVTRLLNMLVNIFGLN
jgi:hypothetical protein